MRSGILRHSVEIQSVTCVPDGMGGQTDSWATKAGGTVRAAIWPISAIEQVRAGAQTMIGTHRVRIRYFPGISGKDRIKFGTRYFAIVSVMDREERNIEMELLCREVLA